MSEHTTQEEIGHVMIEGTVRLFFLVLKHILGPWTFTRAHVNDFSKMGSAGSWEDHYQLDWTSTVGITQVIPTCILIERDMTPLPDAEWYFVQAQDEDEDDEEEDYKHSHIDYYTDVEFS